MEVLRRACQINNGAVMSFISGSTAGRLENDNAHRMQFRRALVLIMDLVNQLDEATDVTTIPPPRSNDIHVNIFYRNESSRLPQMQEQCAFYVHDQAWFLSVPVAENLLQNDDDLHSILQLCASTVMFNMALMNHHQGMYGSDTSLKNAVNLYNIVLQLGQNFHVHSKYWVAGTTLRSIALNNQGQIHYETCNYSHARLCLHESAQLRGFIMEEGHALEENEVRELDLNWILGVPPTGAKGA